MEHIDRSACILRGSEKNGTVASATIIWTERDISTQYSSSFPKEVFEVLPANSIRELIGRLTAQKEKNKRLQTYVANEKLRTGISERALVV